MASGPGSALQQMNTGPGLRGPSEGMVPEKAGGLGAAHVGVGVEPGYHHNGRLPLAGYGLVGHRSPLPDIEEVGVEARHGHIPRQNTDGFYILN
jgi:hypothetical protein